MNLISPQLGNFKYFTSLNVSEEVPEAWERHSKSL